MRVGLVLLVCACRIGFDEAARDGAAGSEGDGGGDGATGDALPVPPDVNRVFVTSATYVPGSLGGRQGADDACAAAASSAGFTGTFVAYVSTTAQVAPDRLRVARGWYRTDGLPFVDTVDDLLARRMFRPIQADERGRKVDDIVATGTKLDGSLDVNCSDWTSQDMYMMGPSDGEEIAFSGWGNRFCSTPAHLYCFQTDFQTPVVAVPESGRLAFYLVDGWTSGGGIGTADTACQNAATGAGLAGSFRALLATSTDSAASRFTDGPTWVRRDGVRLAATAADVLAGNLEAAIAVQASGAHVTAGGNVITGGSSPAVAGTPTTTCMNWTSTSGNATWGRPQQAGRAAFGEAGTTLCSTMHGLYCLER